MFHLITGGSGSGKSEYAEQKLMEYASHSKRNKKRYYIATMMPFGKETEEKIARHRRLRAGKGFETIECYTDLKKAAEVLQTKETGSVLLECMSNLVANEMYDPSGAGENAEESILAGIHKLQKASDDLVVVTNEVFSDSMTMIIGGAYQGKLAYAKKQNPYIHWTDGELCEGDNIFAAEGVFHFEKYIQSMIKKENWSEKEAIDFASKLTKKCPDIVIVTQEIGYGLVPIDAFERRYRELTGRICTVLAANSDQVDRVVCGIGVTIKGGDTK